MRLTQRAPLPARMSWPDSHVMGRWRGAGAPPCSPRHEKTLLDLLDLIPLLSSLFCCAQKRPPHPTPAVFFPCLIPPVPCSEPPIQCAAVGRFCKSKTKHWPLSEAPSLAAPKSAHVKLKCPFVGGMHS